MKRLLIGIAAIVAGLCIAGVITNRRIQKRTAYWESLIDAELPVGSTKEKVEQWGKQRNLHLSWIPGKNFFDSNVERIPDAGIGFPCSQWNVIVDIYMDNDGMLIRRDVHIVGSCV